MVWEFGEDLAGSRAIRHMDEVPKGRSRARRN